MLILVTGLPGSGKSTVAKMLAGELDAVVLNSDTLRRELFPVSRDYSSRETQAVIRETERRTKELLQAGRVVILDALFTKQRPRDEYKNVAEELGAPFVVVLVTAPEEMTKTRMDLREEVGDASEATFAYYLNRKPHFEPVTGEHFVVENDGAAEALKSAVASIAQSLRR